MLLSINSSIIELGNQSISTGNNTFDIKQILAEHGYSQDIFEKLSNENFYIGISSTATGRDDKMYHTFSHSYNSSTGILTINYSARYVDYYGNVNTGSGWWTQPAILSPIIIIK